MPQINHIKKSRRRFARVPASSEASHRTFIQEDGSERQDATAKGEPLPAPVCDWCLKEIPYGSPYKWVQPAIDKSSSNTFERHENCPDWKPWEISEDAKALFAKALTGVVESLPGINEWDEFVNLTVIYGLSLCRISARLNSQAYDLVQAGGRKVTDHKVQRLWHQADSFLKKGEAVILWVYEEEPGEQNCPACFGKGSRYSMRGPALCQVCGGGGRVEFDMATYLENLPPHLLQDPCA